MDDPTRPPAAEGFPREHHIVRRRDFQAAYAEGKRAHGRLVVLFVRGRGDGGPWRLGLTATRKVGNAVRRNRLRRLGREIFRRWGAGLPADCDFVLNFKHGANDADYAALRADVLACLRRLGHEPAAPAPPPPDPERPA